MNKDEEESVAYELAQVLKQNRELRNEVSALNEKLQDSRNYAELLEEKMQKLLSTKEDKLKAEAANGELLTKGDRIVITEKKTDKLLYTTGFVLLVAHNMYTKKGDVCLPIHKVDENGELLKGQGSIRPIRYSQYSWRKVSDDTPLSICTKVEDKNGDYFAMDKMGYNRRYTLHYKNLIQV